MPRKRKGDKDRDPRKQREQEELEALLNVTHDVENKDEDPMLQTSGR